MELTGTVSNGGDGVHIFINAPEEKAVLFLRTLRQGAPAQSRIVSTGLYKTEDKEFPDFSIVVAHEDSLKKRVFMSPDTAICANCRRELHAPADRRYRYPFITCTQCGPRYSIVYELPYERHTTSMRAFSPCKSCSEEYEDPANRRFFSQTNSCADCGIGLRIQANDSSWMANNSERILWYIKAFLQHGKIVAVKGIGGYLLLCNAADPATIRLLRSRKRRPAKPFAVLYADMERVRESFNVHEKEAALLQSEEAPIVLLDPKGDEVDGLALKEIIPGLRRCGIMLPCSPLLELIAHDHEKPLIATSANISGSPIFYKDEDAYAYLFEMADYIVSYNREIVLPQDDSVVQVTPDAQQRILLRRSRGYAPSFLHYEPQTRSCILSTGAFLKSSFTLAIEGKTFISQFLGSGESYESQQMYKDTLDHWLKLYRVKPAVLVADLHPDTFPHQYAIGLAEKYGATLKLIQHHEAHFAAVLAENELLHSSKPVLGVIWDGTGLGTDGHSWGGEFFRYADHEMQRTFHFDYFPLIAGDKPALEPRIAALCACSVAWPSPELLKEKFRADEWNNYQTLIGKATIFTSSVGRIFDAVSSLLGLCDKQTYEGEAAMYLQTLAEKYVRKNGLVMDAAYFKEGFPLHRIPTGTLLQGVLQDLEAGREKSYIAAKFHYSLACLTGFVAATMQVEKICFSGGVFQNTLLVDWIQKEQGGRYQLTFHQHLSPNDENISFGQMVYYDQSINHLKISKTQQSCV